MVARNEEVDVRLRWFARPLLVRTLAAIFGRVPRWFLRVTPVDKEKHMRRGHYEIYADAGGEFRWRLVAPNGEIVGDSGEGYVELRKCRAAVRRFRCLALLSRVRGLVAMLLISLLAAGCASNSISAPTTEMKRETTPVAVPTRNYHRVYRIRVSPASPATRPPAPQEDPNAYS